LTQEIFYLCIFRNEQGEKLGEKVTARVPIVGEIIRITYVDTSGEFEVLKEVQRKTLPDYETVTLQVRRVIPKEPGNSSISKGLKLLYMLFQTQ